MRTAWAVALSATAALGCSRSCEQPAQRGKADPHETELAQLRSWEDTARRATDFAHRPPADRSLGPNPYRLARLADGRAVGILRGADALVLLDARGGEEARVATPPSPTALLVDVDGVVWVGGTGSPEIARYRTSPALAELDRVRLDGWTVRALAEGGPGWIYAADERTGAVTALAVDRAARDAPPAVVERRELARCRSPIELARGAHHLVVNCLYDHALVAHPIDGAGGPAGGAPAVRMKHDGPFWSVTAAGDLVAAGGVEDHPLERKGGGFGYIDSFLYVYRLPEGTRIAAINLSAAGVVTPKWVRLEDAGGVPRITSAGYATGLIAEVELRGGSDPEVKTRPFLPGTTDYLPGQPALAASPLLDAWLVGDPSPVVVDVPGAAPRSLDSRIGEALVFTTLMAPWGSSDGKKSRFTCETCHFEAQGDGRVHYTGRGDVHAATKPLRGLWNNRPHFTRALDRTTTGMVHAEFRVANRWNGRDPWFEVGVADIPWLPAIRGAPARLGPVELRRDFMAFLADLTYESNPAVRGRTGFDARERAGAALFRDRCESCHRARLVTEDPATAVPFERWEELILSPAGPIVWASAEYQKTGILPYVHEKGARTTSLRRVAQKQPIFTNGSARTLSDVLDRARFAGERFLHEASGEKRVTALTQSERDALLAFLELL